jgi:hypothetical protein
MSLWDREFSGVHLTVKLEQIEEGASVQFCEALHLASLHLACHRSTDSTELMGQLSIDIVYGEWQHHQAVWPRIRQSWSFSFSVHGLQRLIAIQ